MRYIDRILDADDTPLRWLTRHLASAVDFDAQVGYLDRSGVELIASPLFDLLDRDGRVHIIVDARNGHPRYGDLAWLLERFSPYGQRATVALARDASPLHAKVFSVCGGDGERRALVGSANLTGAGLTKNWEACIALDPGDAEALAAIGTAAKAWQERPTTVDVDLGVLASLTPPGPTGKSIVLADGLQETLDRIESVGVNGDIGLPTGHSDLDLLINGLHAGELVLVAGRPAMGKSTLALGFLRHISLRHGMPSLLFSFEMSRIELLLRLLSAETRVPLQVLRSGQMSDSDWTKLAERMARLSEGPLFINDTCVPSIRNVADEARRAVAEDDVRLIAVDYVQQLHIDRRTENRQHEIAEVSRRLKHLARELQVPVVAVSQLNRGPEGRIDKRPLMSDLRDSGGLEQDADAVILLHRDDYYDKESPRAGEADIIVAKQRNGPTDTVTVAAQLHYARFVDMAV